MSVDFGVEFSGRYGREPDGLWVAPGRVNLIGEHTDYNDGFVLPLALRLSVVAAVAPRNDGSIRAASLQEDGVVECRVDQLVPGRIDGWAAYVAGVVWALRDAGHAIGGVDLLCDGDVPPGAGLSSSAALECATALALANIHSLDLQLPELALIAQRAENQFVGTPCGIMDQFASLLCAAGHALFLDTRSLEFAQVPLPLAAAGLALLVIDTRASHRLVDGKYAARRRDCEAAAALLGVPALRDVAGEGLGDTLAALPSERLRRRVRHVVTENIRVTDTVALLRDGKVEQVGPLLSASHASLRDDYEVSSPELDLAVDIAGAAGALGARMTGAGFGGSAIALVTEDRADMVATALADAFAASALAAPDVFMATAGPGARRLR